jgi:hypothetical protein
MAPNIALSTASKLLGLSTPFYLLTALFSGAIFVHFGRRISIFLAFFLGVIGALLMPFVN